MATVTHLPSSASSLFESGRTAWDSPSNALTNDGSQATAVVPTSGVASITEYLALTGYGFSIPTSATIDGIEAHIVGSTTSSGLTIEGNTLSLTKDGTTNNGNYALGGGTFTNSVYGTPTNK